jgi:hypothetical protein
MQGAHTPTTPGRIIHSRDRESGSIEPDPWFLRYLPPHDRCALLILVCALLGVGYCVSSICLNEENRISVIVASIGTRIRITAAASGDLLTFRLIKGPSSSHTLRGIDRYWQNDGAFHEEVSKPCENLDGIRFSCGFTYRQFVPEGF